MMPAALLLALLGASDTFDPDPPASDAGGFPPCAVAWHNLEMARAHRDWLDEQHRQRLLGPDYWLRREDAAWRVECWEACHTLQNAPAWDCPESDEASRVYWLRALRSLLGPDAYLAARLPAPVPVPWEGPWRP